MIAVVNSSPWIFLSGLGIIRESANLFDELIVPLSVYEEIIRKQDIAAEMLTKLRKEDAYAVCQAEKNPGTLGIIRRLMELDRYKSDIESLYLLLRKMNFRISDRIFYAVFKTENIRPDKEL